MNGSHVTSGCLLLLAIAHSILGEREILMPLFRAEWSIALPRKATESVLRFAWHLTSIAWVALAAVVVDAAVLPVVAAMCIVSAAVVFVVLRAHLAWPVFLLGGLAALQADNRLPDVLLRGTAVGTVLVLVAASVLHIYWASGGRWLFEKAIPTGGSTSFTPGPLLTLAVAVALGGFAALVLAVVNDVGPASTRWLVGAGLVVFVIRAIGDARVVGFTKTIRGTPFAVADDLYFTPLVVLLAFGAAAALLV
jgi:hypothetical protein